MIFHVSLGGQHELQSNHSFFDSVIGKEDAFDICGDVLEDSFFVIIPILSSASSFDSSQAVCACDKRAEPISLATKVWNEHVIY